MKLVYGYGLSILIILLVALGVFWTSYDDGGGALFLNAQKPAKPAPAKPVPAKPAPAKPVPAKPAPAKPVPAKPVPAKAPNTTKKSAVKNVPAVAPVQPVVNKKAQDAITAQETLITNLKNKAKGKKGKEATVATNLIATEVAKLKELKGKLPTGAAQGPVDKAAQAKLKSLYDKADAAQKLADEAKKADPKSTLGKKAADLARAAEKAAATAETAAAAYAKDRMRYFRPDTGGGVVNNYSSINSNGTTLTLTNEQFAAAKLKPNTTGTYNGQVFEVGAESIGKDGKIIHNIITRPCKGVECKGNSLDAKTAAILANGALSSSKELTPGKIYSVPSADGKNLELYKVEKNGDVIPYKENPKDAKPVTCPMPSSGHDELRFLQGGSGGCNQATRLSPASAALAAIAAGRALFGRGGRGTPAPGAPVRPANGAVAGPSVVAQVTTSSSTLSRNSVNNIESAARFSDRASLAMDIATNPRSTAVDMATATESAINASNRVTSLSNEAQRQLPILSRAFDEAANNYRHASNTGQPTPVLDALYAKMKAAGQKIDDARETADKLKTLALSTATMANHARAAADIPRRPTSVDAQTFLEAVTANYGFTPRPEEIARVYGPVVTAEQVRNYQPTEESTHIDMTGTSITNISPGLVAYVMRNPAQARNLGAAGYYGTNVSEADGILFRAAYQTYGNINRSANDYRNFQERHPEYQRAGITADAFAAVSTFPRPPGKSNRDVVWENFQRQYVGTRFLLDNNITRNNFNAIRNTVSDRPGPSTELTVARPSSQPPLRFEIGRPNANGNFTSIDRIISVRDFRDRNPGATYQQYARAAADMGLTTANGGLESQAVFERPPPSYEDDKLYINSYDR